MPLVHASVKSTLRGGSAEDDLIDEDPDAEGDEGDERAESEHLEPRDPPRARGHR